MDYKGILSSIHNKLKFLYGSLNDEYPEQLLSVQFIQPHHRVLELGGNVGRNSCVIASILNDSKNLLVIESDPDNANKLKINGDNNNLKFLIEDSAISKIDLYQKDWLTKPLEDIKDSISQWKQIKTITWSQIKEKYNMNFDVLVADCEGALYYIIKEEPTFLESFNLIQIENDFPNKYQKDFVDEEFKKLGFKRIHQELGNFQHPASEFFYEIWSR
jgi:FkbM family methyltransferase